MTDITKIAEARRLIERAMHEADDEQHDTLADAIAALDASRQSAPPAASSESGALDFPPLPKPCAHIGKFLDDEIAVFDGGQMRAFYVQGYAAALSTRDAASERAAPDAQAEREEAWRDFDLKAEMLPAQAETTVDVNSGMDALPANGPASDSDRAVYQSIADRYWRDAQAGTVEGLAELLDELEAARESFSTHHTTIGQVLDKAIETIQRLAALASRPATEGTAEGLAAQFDAFWSLVCEGKRLSELPGLRDSERLRQLNIRTVAALSSLRAALASREAQAETPAADAHLLTTALNRAEPLTEEDYSREREAIQRLASR